MKSLKYYSLIIILACVFTIGYSQHGEGKHHKHDYEAIQAEKIAFFTEQIGLTPEEAEKFWPVYNEFHSKKWEIMEKRKNAIKQLEKEENLTDKNIERYTNEIVISFKEEYELIEQYNLKFKNILPSEKVAKFYIAEHKFKRYLLNKLKGPKNK